MNPRSLSLKMLIYDWYDGPVGGVVTLADDGDYCFYLLDWDSVHRIRVLGLQSLAVEVEPMIRQLTAENPKWPVWFPADLVQPTERSREWTNSVKALRNCPDRIDGVLIWDSLAERAIAIQRLPSDACENFTPWFDAIESEMGPFDWFGFLSISRN